MQMACESWIKLSAGLARCVLLACSIGWAGLAWAQDSSSSSDRLQQLNEVFLRHVRELRNTQVIAAITILDGWESTYRGRLEESFVPDALAVLYPTYRDALRAFDEDQAADVVRLLEPLRTSEDGFLAANSSYFYVRALVALGRYEQAEAALATIDARRDDYAAHTPYAPHLWLIKGFCEARDLRFDQAAETLHSLQAHFGDAPEAVRVGAAQLLLEIERRERGTLDEVATVMDYVADRLSVVDTDQRVHDRQREIIALLDKLIEQQQQQEQQSGGGGHARGGNKGMPQASPGRPRQESEAPGGAGQIGGLHGAPQAEPGETWGKLPPAERERVLQSIREKFPSRYRQLVEQYYRALGEEK